MRRIWPVGITALLSISAGAIPAQGEGLDLLVRPKISYSARMLSEEGKREERLSVPFEKKEFTSEEEKSRFLSEECGKRFDCEKNSTFRGDSIYLDPATLAVIEATLLSDPKSANQWSLFSTPEQVDLYGGANIDVARAWTLFEGPAHKEDIAIYVVDSGVADRDLNPDFVGQFVANFSAITPNQSFTDSNGHGTHVSSIIGAKGKNDYGMVGVIKSPVDMVDVQFLDASNSGRTDLALQAWDFVYNDLQKRQPKHCIVSNSYGGPDYSQAFYDRVARVVTKFDCVIITSAGNHGKNNDSAPYYPCNFELGGNNVCVAASGIDDKLASFSGFGPKTVHVMAPGVTIFGAAPGNVSGDVYTAKYAIKSGTSQAGPHVAGIAGLIWSANPELIGKDVRDVLMESVDRIASADGKVASGGRVNAYRAVLIATGRDPSLANRPTGGGGCALGNSTDKYSIGFLLWVFFSGFLVISLQARFARLSSKRSVSKPKRSAVSAKRRR